MGITGLLKGLQCVSQQQNVCDFAGKTLAVDLSSWLHKSVYSVSERYVESSGNDQVSLQASTRYIASRCTELLHHAKIQKLYLVLDGDRCPLKAVTNTSREERRQENLAEARRYKALGRHDKARDKYKACIKITAAFADSVARIVQQRLGGKVECVYSPQEADAQLVKLCVDGLADGVITEDSDVLVYSCACRVSFPILFKLDRNSGACDVVNMEWLWNSSLSEWEKESGRNKKEKGNNNSSGLVSTLKSLSSRERRCPGMGVRLFVQACVLTGCDYAPSQLNGVGLVTAFKLIRENANRPCPDRFRHVLKSLSHKKTSGNQFSNTKEMMVQYEELLAKSEAVFYYHPVLQGRSVVPLTTLRTNDASAEQLLYSPSLERFGDWSFLGKLEGFDTNAEQKDKECHDEVPISEIIIKRPPPKQRKKSKTKRLALQPVTNARVVNPYNKKNKKRLREKALVDTKQYEKDTNQFVAFEYSGDENEPQPPTARKHVDPRLLYGQNRQDVRFVRPKFSVSGRKKPKLSAYKSETKKSAKSTKSRGSSARCPPRRTGHDKQSRRASNNRKEDSTDFDFEVSAARLPPTRTGDDHRSRPIDFEVSAARLPPTRTCDDHRSRTVDFEVSAARLPPTRTGDDRRSRPLDFEVSAARLPPTRTGDDHRSRTASNNRKDDSKDFDFEVSSEFEVVSSRSIDAFASRDERGQFSDSEDPPGESCCNDLLERFERTAGPKIVSGSSSVAEGCADESKDQLVYTIGDENEHECNGGEQDIVQVNDSFPHAFYDETSIPIQEGVYDEGIGEFNHTEGACARRDTADVVYTFRDDDQLIECVDGEPEITVVPAQESFNGELMTGFEHTDEPSGMMPEPYERNGSALEAKNPIVRTFGNEDELDYYDEEEDKGNSKYWARQNVRRVTRSPSFPRMHEFPSASDLLEDTISSDYASNGIDRDERPTSVYTTGVSEKDEIHFPSYEAEAPIDSVTDKSAAYGMARSNRTPYQSGADWIERQNTAFSQDSDDEYFDLGKFKTPFEASQARGLRSLGFATKQSEKKHGTLDGFLYQPKDRATSRRPSSASSSIGVFQKRRSGTNRQRRSSAMSGIKHGTNRQRRSSAVSGIKHFFKPIITLNDSDDDF